MPRSARPAGRFQDLGLFQLPGFPARRLTAHLPPGHDPAVPTPLLLVLDGQNAFGDEGTASGGWHLHTALDGMDPRRYVHPVVVAIPHGGATRQDELTPWATDGQGGKAGQFLAWMALALLPELRRRFLTPEGALGAAIAGASWGGLAAFYAHFTYPHLLGGALCLSPSFWVGNFAALDWLGRMPTPSLSRIYLDCGAHEAEGRMLPPAREVAHRLAARGYPRRQLWWRPDPRGDHTEGDWRRRLPRAVRFMYRR